MSFREKLESGKFVITAELAPPKGVNLDETLAMLPHLKGVDAVNVTDNQRAVMRLNSASLCRILLDQEIEPIFQITCRDRNRLALQSDLLGAYVLGIRNVLVVSGDHPSQGDHPRAKIVYDVDSVQLLQIASDMEKGKSQAGAELEGAPNFFKGAVVNPGIAPLEPQLLKMEKKVEAGAQFFQTQLVYDLEMFEGFLTQAPKSKILAGILPLKSAKMAKFLNENVPGVRVPEEIIREIESGKSGIEIAAETINELKNMCAGVHIMTVGHEEQVAEILALLA